MKPYLYILASFGFLCIACHSSRKIRIENRTGGDASVVWTIKEDSIHQSPLYTSSSTESSFVISNGRHHNKLKMSVGVGSWTPATLRNFVDDLESMQIKWERQTIKLDSTEIIKFLSARRRGFDKSQILIVLR